MTKTLAISGASVSAGTGLSKSGTTISLINPVVLANGGTNASLTASNGGIFYSSSTAGAILAGTATAGLALVSGASTTPSWFVPTAGSVLFAGTGGILQQDNANFFWDDANNRLGLGTTAPANFILDFAGHIGPHADATYDIGTSSVRMRTIYINDAVRAGSGNFAFFKALAGNDMQLSDVSWRDIIFPQTTSNIVRPSGNKTTDLGATGARWANIYYSSATTGTSRLCDSNTNCPDCPGNPVMKRGTGTDYTLGEIGDYIQVWCTNCFHTMMEKISNLPPEWLSRRQPAPMIRFLGLRINQLSGNTRNIYVDFQYTEDIISHDEIGNEVITPGLHNSTILGEKEATNIQDMSQDQVKQFLKSLGQREWDSLEEVRLMKEYLETQREQFDALTRAFVNQDLLK